MKCPGLVADDLSGFWRFSKPGDRDATEGTDGAVSGCIGAVSGRAVELCRGGRAARGQRAALPPAARPVRGKRRRGPDRSPARARLGAAGAGGPDRVCGGAVSDTLRGLHGEAFSRSAAGRARVCAGLHLDQDGAAEPRLGGDRAAPAAARHDAVSGRLAAAWLAGQAPLDLIVTLDDATSAIYSMFLVEEEGTASSFGGLDEVISRHGLFSSLYTDRGSHYFTTPKAGGTVDKQQPTQVGRALAELRIEHIPSYSPGARGRMERVFGTLQQRLPLLLRLNGITTIEAANRYLAETYLPEHNARFAVAPAEEGSAFVPFAAGLRDILCIKHERVVGRDNCVRYDGRILQIPEQRHRHHFVKVTVQVHEYRDGTMALFHGPRYLAGYTEDGTLISQQNQTKSAA